MAEYIEREALIKKIDEGFDKTDPCGEEQIGFLKCRRIVREILAADVAPVRHGQWDGEGDGYADGEIVIDVWYCSKCGYCIDDGTDDPNILPNYCPHCGAKMDGDTDAP